MSESTVTLAIGIKGNYEISVDETNTADAFGSGNLPVFATPAMIAMMEYTAAKSVAPALAEGQSTVGTLVNVKHLAATPKGMRVSFETEITEIDRRRIVFSVRAFDERGLIGEGVHERFIVDSEKFLSKTYGDRV